jgi:hypothetical protein
MRPLPWLPYQSWAGDALQVLQLLPGRASIAWLLLLLLVVVVVHVLLLLVVHVLLRRRQRHTVHVLVLLVLEVHAVLLLLLLLVHILLLLLWHGPLLLILVHVLVRLLLLLWRDLLLVQQVRLLDLLHALAVLHGSWPLVAAAAGDVTHCIHSSTSCPTLCRHGHCRRGLLHVLCTLGAAAAPSAKHMGLFAMWHGHMPMSMGNTLSRQGMEDLPCGAVPPAL